MMPRRTPSLVGMDLQLLVALELLLETRSVTATAQKLRVSQSATSHTLRRLREVFADELLVRGRAGMVLTARAQELRDPLRSCLRELRELIEPAQPFSPATSKLRFRISATDFLALRFAPALLALAQREAPHLDFEIKTVPAQSYAKLLENGDLDLMIGSVLIAEHLGLMRRDLAQEPMACAVRQGHPRIRGPMSIEDYLGEAHVLVTPVQRDHRGIVDQHLDRLGMQRTIAAYVTSFLLAPHIVAGSDLLLTAPRALLETYASSMGLKILAPPFELTAFPVRMLWHERTQVDPARRWLREAVIRAYAVPGSPAGASGGRRRARSPRAPA